MNPFVRKLAALAVTTLGALALLLLIKAGVSSACYTVGMKESVIITRFGEIRGQPINEPGLHWKYPFVDTVNRIDRRVQEWDGLAVSMPTGDKLYTIIDSFGRWYVEDPITYFTQVKDERSAHSRIDDIAGSEIPNAVGKYDLVEILRTDKARTAGVDTNAEGMASRLPSIQVGRTAIERSILENAAPKVATLGLRLTDVRFMRVNYNKDVGEQIKARMISERKQMADRYRSEGEGEAANILGQREKDLQEITSEAYKEAQKIRGEADATAMDIYAKAFNQSPEAAELYGFLKTLETYRRSVTNTTTLVLTTESELFRTFKTSATQK